MQIVKRIKTVVGSSGVILICTAVGSLTGISLFLGAQFRKSPAEISFEGDYGNLEGDYAHLIDSQVPEVPLQMLDGTLSSSHHFVNKLHLLAFSDPECGLCDEFYPVLQETVKHLPVLLISSREDDFLRSKAAEEDLRLLVALDPDRKLGRTLNLTGVPTALLIGADRRILKAETGIRSASEVARFAVLQNGYKVNLQKMQHQ